MSSSGITVRLGTTADVEAAQSLIRATFPYHPVWQRDVDAFAESYVETPGQAFIVAVADGEVVGTAVIRRRVPPAAWAARRMPPGSTCELGRVVVVPPLRRHGLALRLTEAARVWAREAGYTSMHLHTDTSNVPALALWRSLAIELIPDDPAQASETVFFALPIDIEVARASAPSPR